MVEATETFAVGADQFTVAVEIDLNTVWLISGDFVGIIPSGQVGFINGDVNLTGDLIVEGLLTGVDTFTLTGNGFQILVQNGGQLNLQGVQKSGWLPWGKTPVGWQPGDRIAISPTKAGVFTPTEGIWTGDWTSLIRPPNSPDFPLLPNVVVPPRTVAIPEVANLSQTIVLQNLRRIHFHDGAGVATLKWLKVLNSGTTGVLADYPIHFHLNGEASRGSLLEGVVVEGGKNHAVVPHGSHGITFRDVVVYRQVGASDAWWWDPPPSIFNPVNNSNDIAYEHVLGMWMGIGSNAIRRAGFLLGEGADCSVTDSVMTCLQGGGDAGGFSWPEWAGAVWIFERNVAHNNKADGIFVWQNDASDHIIEDFVGYNNGLCQVDHGAYGNHYQYRRLVLMGGAEGSFKIHAHGPIVVEDAAADGKLIVTKHISNPPPGEFVVFRNGSFASVWYQETGDGGVHFSQIRFENYGLVPADFHLDRVVPGSQDGIVASSIIEITEGGVLTHRWAAGAWT